MTTPGPLAVPTPPNLPLARTVEMPEHVGYPSGALSLRFTELTVEPLATPGAVPVSDGDRTVVALPPLLVRARYAIDATPDRIATVDGGGDLSVLPNPATAPRSGDDSDKHPEWLENARRQRMRLAQTESGRSLLNLYGLHEKVYTELFDPNLGTFVDDVWTINEGTAQMAAHTHDVIGSGEGAVNDPEHSYLTPDEQMANYNVNAFTRELAAANYILALEGIGSQTQDEYNAASQAALDFADVVGNGTGNKTDSVNPMTREDVYQAVERHPSAEARSSSESAQRRFAAILNPFADDVWEGWDDDERDLIREFHRKAAAGRERLRAAAVSTVLFEGTGSGRITGAAAVTDASGTVRVELPDFGIVLDDTAWSGAAATIARERLNAAGFLADLVRDAVAERLRAAVVSGDPTLLAEPAR